MREMVEIVSEVIAEGVSNITDNISNTAKEYHDGIRDFYYDHTGGPSQEKKIQVAEEFVYKYAQAYCDAIYADASTINDDERYDNDIDVSFPYWRNTTDAYVLRTKRGKFANWDWSFGRQAQENGLGVYGIWNACADELGYCEYADEAALIASMLLVFALSRAYEESGFYVSVLQEKNGEWLLNLSWEQGVS